MSYCLDCIQTSFKTLASRPFLSVLSILTMGVGIGTLMNHFIIYKGVMDPNLPFPNSEEIVTVSFVGDVEQSNKNIPKHLIYYWINNQTSFEALSSFQEGTINVYYQNRAIRYSGGWVHPNLMDMLKAKPFLGETFKPGDDELESPKKVILSYKIWKNDFAADPSIVGKEILVNSESTMVVGVMEEGFHFPFQSDLWVPDTYYPGAMLPYDPKPTSMVAARLKEGVSMVDAGKELDQLKEDFVAAIPKLYQASIPTDSQVNVASFVSMMTDEVTRNIMKLMAAVVILVMFIASANVSNLMLASASTRLKEIAIRNAVGANRTQIITLLLLEGAIIASSGIVPGTIFSLWTIDWVNAQITQQNEIPFWFQFSVTGTSILWGSTIAVITGLVAGILPALKVSKLKMSQILQDDSRTASSLHVNATNRTLVVLQISVSCALLVVAGMMIRQIASYQNKTFTFESDSVLTARLGLFDGKYKSLESKNEFIQTLLRNLRNEELISSAAISTRLQNLYSSFDLGFQLPTEDGTGFKDQEHRSHSDLVTTDYFDVLGVGPIEGRKFPERIVSGPTEDLEVIVTEEFVEKHFPDESPIGKRISIRTIDQSSKIKKIGKTYEIIGIAPDTFVHNDYIDEIDSVGIYLNILKAPPRFITIMVRPAEGLNPYSLVPLLKRSVAEVDKEIPLYFIETPGDSLKQEYAGLQFAAEWFSILSGLALFLSFVGIFGISSFSILQRIQEIGIRKSIGSTSLEIFTLILRQGLAQLLLGLTLGVIAALTLSVALKDLTYNINPFDPIVYLSVILILTVSTLLAAIYPASKAARIMPAEATRVQ